MVVPLFSSAEGYLKSISLRMNANADEGVLTDLENASN